jgi:hypothetical protein
MNAWDGWAEQDGLAAAAGGCAADPVGPDFIVARKPCAWKYLCPGSKLERSHAREVP